MDGSRRDPYLDQRMVGFIEKFARKNYWRVSSWIDLDDLIQDGMMCYAKCRRRYVDDLGTLPERPITSDHRKMMMGAVMTAFARHVHGLASYRTEHDAECCLSDMVSSDDDARDVVDNIHAESGIESCVALLVNAPPEIAELFRILVEDARAAATFVRDGFGRRETMNQHARRVTAGGSLIKSRRSRTRRQIEPLYWQIVRGDAICCGGSTRVRMGRRALRETTNEFYCRLLGLDPRNNDVRGMVRDYLS